MPAYLSKSEVGGRSVLHHNAHLLVYHQLGKGVKGVPPSNEQVGENVSGKELSQKEADEEKEVEGICQKAPESTANAV